LSKKNGDGHNFLTDSASAGQRIDKFLSDNLKDISRSRIQKLISEGKVLVGDKPVSKNYRLAEGDNNRELTAINRFRPRRYKS